MIVNPPLSRSPSPRDLITLTRLLVQDLLEFGPFVLCGLLQEERPQTLCGQVDHVHLHQPQHTDDLPEGRVRKSIFII